MIVCRPNRNSGKLAVQLVLVLILVAGGAGGGFLFAKRSLGASAATVTQEQTPTETGEAEAATAVVELGQFLVNVEATAGLHYLRAEIAVETEAPPTGSKPKSAEAHGEEKPETYQFPPGDQAKAKDAIVRVLSSARFESLRTPEGKEKLKAQLLEAVKEKLPQEKVRGILFVSFVMQ